MAREDKDAPRPDESGQKGEPGWSERAGAATGSSAAEEAMAALRQALQGKQFASEEEMHAFVQDFMARWGRRPLDDFCGLSPEQMHRLLHFPFDSPQLVVFPTQASLPPAAPLLTLVEALLEAIGEQGLKATAKGNLPR
jgi:hypothetical protein